MGTEDFIKRQINQLSRVLGKILFDLLNRQTDGNIMDITKELNEALKSELNLTLDEVISIPDTEFIKTLKLSEEFNENNFELLSNILLIIAESLNGELQNRGESLKLYSKSLIIFEFLEASSKTYSYERHLKIKKIKNELDLMT